MCNSFVNTFTLYLVQVCKIFPSLSPDECQKLLEACKIGMPSYVAEVAMTIPSVRNSMLYNFLEEINIIKAANYFVFIKEVNNI